MAESDNDAPPENGAALAQDAVRDPASGHAYQINQGHVDAVDCARFRIRKSQPAGGDGARHVKKQDGAHAIKAEALPHFGEKESRKSARMTEEGTVPSGDLR